MDDERFVLRPILAVSFCLDGFDIVARGMDELDLEQVCTAICSDHGEVFASEPKVVLLESIRVSAESEGKYIRQTAGLGNYGHVKLHLEPRPEGTGFRFANQLPETQLPGEYAAAVEAGIGEAACGGVLFGYEIVDVKATLIDASYHETDSNAMAFQIAGAIAFKEAAKKASPVLLEPMMAVDFLVDLTNVADTVSELNARRGRIQNIEPHAGLMEIKALVPLREMLRSSRHGRPDYPMHFARYEPTREPPGKFGEGSAGVTANLPKSPRLGNRYAGSSARY